MTVNVLSLVNEHISCELALGNKNYFFNNFIYKEASTGVENNKR